MTSVNNPKPIIVSVDDDEGCALLIRRSFEDRWPTKRIEQLSNGQALLDFLYNTGGNKKCEEGHAYVVLLDIRMPGLSGIDVLRRLRADPQMRAVPVIMFSTTEDPQEVARCYQLGCSAFIQKPVDYHEFTDTVQRIADFLAMLLVPPLMHGERREIAEVRTLVRASPSGSGSPFALTLA